MERKSWVASRESWVVNRERRASRRKPDVSVHKDMSSVSAERENRQEASPAFLLSTVCCLPFQLLTTGY